MLAAKEKSEKTPSKGSETASGKAPSAPKPVQKEKVGAEDIKGIVRIAGKDVKGDMPLRKALCHVKGVGKRYADVCATIAANKLNIEENIPVGKLSDAQLDEIESILSNPLDNGLPVYMLNKRHEFTTGKDVHLIANDLDYSVKQDIDRERKTKTWRGISHMYRKKVRGQRTRTSGRRGGTVGVVRKKVTPGSAPAKKDEKKK